MQNVIVAKNASAAFVDLWLTADLSNPNLPAYGWTPDIGKAIKMDDVALNDIMSSFHQLDDFGSRMIKAAFPNNGRGKIIGGALTVFPKHEVQCGSF